MTAQRITRVSRLVADLGRAVRFYGDALGFQQVAGGTPCGAILAELGGPAKQAVMRLGEEEVALLQLDRPGASCPAAGRADDLWFQHLAIVVSDMNAAYARLSAQAFQPISTAGPERLPPENGAVMAFKFRDPDGHPLELIGFPSGTGRPVWRQHGGGPCLGIDHTAIAVADVGRSLDFYAGLGFQEVSRSCNHGPAQARLDGVPDATLTVVGLRLPGAAGPGLELLGYDPPGRAITVLPPDTLARDWITLCGAADAALLRDPDGHRILLSTTPA